MTNAIDIDVTRTVDLTTAVFTCRDQMGPIVEFLRKFAPGYESCYIVSSGSLIRVGETRHFEGEYTLTEHDILETRQFLDWVVKGAH